MRKSLTSDEVQANFSEITKGTPSIAENNGEGNFSKISVISEGAHLKFPQGAGLTRDGI